MSDERLRLVAELQNKASAELRRLTKDMQGVKPTNGMMAAQKWFSAFRGETDKAVGALKPVSGMLGAVGLGSIAAGFSLGEMVKQFRELADSTANLKELGRQSGMTATEVKRLQYVAQRLHVDPSQMDAAVDAFSGQMVQFKRHTSDFYKEMLRQNGDVAAKIASDNPLDAIKDTIEYLSKIKDPQVQKYWAGEVGLGSILPIIGKSAQERALAYKEAAQDVPEVTAALIAQAEALNASIAKFDQSWNSFKADVAPTVFKGLTAATDDLRKVFDEIRNNPVNAAVIAGGAASLYARHRILKGSSLSGAGLGRAAGQLTAAAADLKAAAAVLRETKAVAGSPAAGKEPGKPGSTSFDHGRALLAAAGLVGLALNAPGMDKDGEKERDANRVGVEGLGNALGFGYLDRARESMFGKNGSIFTAMGDWWKARHEEHAAVATNTDGNALRRDDGTPSSSLARDLFKSTEAGSKAGTIAAWREMLQQQDLDRNHQEDGASGPGAPSMRRGRGADGQYRRSPRGGGYKFYKDTPDGQGHAEAVKGGMAMRAMAAMNYLVDKKGWTPEGAAIAVGNAMQESSVTPNGKPGDPNTPGGSHYMFQWNNGRNNDQVHGRRATIERWTEEHGGSLNTMESNLDAMDEERKHRSGLEAEWDKQRDLRNAGRLGHAFEGYGDNSEGTRVQHARDMLDLWKKSHPGMPTPAHASGGPISGPGGPRSDSIFALLSNGEFVVNARDAERHAGLLHAINSGGLPTFADGGLVADAKARRASWLSFFRRPLPNGGMGAPGHFALGATAMMNGESGWSLNPSTYGWDVNGPSGGTAQWHDVTKGPGAGKLHRLSDLMAMAMQQHEDWHSVPLQQAWWKHEALGPMRYAWNAMRRARSATGTLRAGINSFEVPDDKGLEFQRRLPNIMRLARESMPAQAAHQIDPVEITIRHHPNGRTSVQAKSGKGIKLGIRTNPTMQQI